MNTLQNPPQNPLMQAIAAQRPVIYVVSWEEEQLAQLLGEVSHSLFGDSRPIWEWSAVHGFTSGPGSELELKDPVDALKYIVEQPDDALYLMKDLPAFFDSHPAVLRGIREAYDTFAVRPGKLVISHPQMYVPQAVKREIHLIELPLPDINQRLKHLLTLNRELDSTQQLPATWLSHIASAMKGLTLNESRDLLRKLLSNKADRLEQILTWVNEARAQVLMKENCLQLILDKIDIDRLGGLDKLKRWTVSRQQLFSKEARDKRIKAPSGILIMGVSGCGKSLAAKIIPTVWDLPLIRLDMNLIMSGGWGTPEVAWERSLKAVENAAPVVLWIDEMENSFGYMNDSITSGNMTIFSSFLTWMQEKPENVFVAATANKIEILPPEMIRKGRFDQLFFVDLPHKKARIEILRIHFQQQGIDPYQFDINRIAELTHEWTAAEIEQMVRSAQIDSFTAGRYLNFDDIVQNIYNIVPLSRTMSREINALRSWARDRATPAA